MNSMFDRLGEMLKDYIDEDEQDIFSKPKEDKFTEKNNEKPKEKVNESFDTNTETKKDAEQAKPKETIKNKTQKKQTFTFDTDNQQKTNYTKEQSKSSFQKRATQQQKPLHNHTHYKAQQGTFKKFIPESFKPSLQIPVQIIKDLDFFGLPHTATLDDCKAVYKKLLKVYHPDRHTGNNENLKTATEFSSRVNTAYARLEEWFAKE